MIAVQCLRNVSSTVQKQQHRYFFAFLNFIFNRVSKSRINEVGPDRACAEWLMRNGAHIKWKGDHDFVQHYNGLPLDPKIKTAFRISHVKAINASINSVGFTHFSGCNEITDMDFHNCAYFDDKCIGLLRYVKKSLSSLKITCCHEITDKGLQEVLNLSLLTDLVLGDLRGVKNLNMFSKDLETALPKCKLKILQHPIKHPDDSQSDKSIGLFSSPRN